jgi:hypothetical protein
MTTVYWNIFQANKIVQDDCMVLSHFDPEPVLPYIIKNRVATTDDYLTCPAFLDYYKNTYVIRSPVDIKIMFNSNTRTLNILPQRQEFYDTFIKYRGDLNAISNPFLMSFALFYLFISNDDCMLEQTPVSLHDTSFSSKIRLIGGTFNINKWFRPVEFGFEFINENEPLIIKRGDPMYYIRFVPKNGKKVTLVKKQFSEADHASVMACANLKKGMEKQPFKVLYELAKRIKPKVAKKCPFNWR